MPVGGHHGQVINARPGSTPPAAWPTWISIYLL